MASLSTCTHLYNLLARMHTQTRFMKQQSIRILLTMSPPFTPISLVSCVRCLGLIFVRTQVVASGHLVPVLGVFQRLLASNLHDHEAFYIIESVVQYLKPEELQPYVQQVPQQTEPVVVFCEYERVGSCVSTWRSPDLL